MTGSDHAAKNSIPQGILAIPPSQVTVAVEGWNADNLESRALFVRSLQSLRQQTYPVAQCQVLVLVDATDVARQAEWIGDELPGAKIIGIASETYYRAKNASMSAARGQYLVFADSDVSYAPTWLAAMLSSFRPGVDLVVGQTRFQPGFLSRTLDLCDWAAARPQSGFTDWFYGNNLAMRRSLFETLRFREDMGRSGGGSVNVARRELMGRGVRFWFCAEAQARHDLAPFFVKRIRIGAYQIRHRRLAPDAPWSWVARVPLAGPFLATGGSMVMAWRRAWRMRSTLPAKGFSLPLYLASIAFVKSVEALGAVLYAWAPSLVSGRYDWFDVPMVQPSGIAHQTEIR